MHYETANQHRLWLPLSDFPGNREDSRGRRALDATPFRVTFNALMSRALPNAGMQAPTPSLTCIATENSALDLGVVVEAMTWCSRAWPALEPRLARRKGFYGA